VTDPAKRRALLADGALALWLVVTAGIYLGQFGSSLSMLARVLGLR
jgi:hypothetical protein